MPQELEGRGKKGWLGLLGGVGLMLLVLMQAGHFFLHGGKTISFFKVKIL